MNQNLYSYILKRSCFNIQKCIHTSRGNTANYYEILKLKKNCTAKEIRDSFIKLSKEHHPDINKSPKAHNQFLKIQEAYKVLSKPESKASYDVSISNPVYYSRPFHTVYKDPGYREPYGQKGRNPWDDPFFYHNCDKSQDTYYEGQPYYGIKGIEKVSNGTIAFMCIIVAIISFSLQLLTVNYSYSRKKQHSDKLAATLKDIKDRADKNGNKVQLEILKQHFEDQERKKIGYIRTID